MLRYEMENEIIERKFINKEFKTDFKFFCKVSGNIESHYRNHFKRLIVYLLIVCCLIQLQSFIVSIISGNQVLSHEKIITVIMLCFMVE